MKSLVGGCGWDFFCGWVVRTKNRSAIDVGANEGGFAAVFLEQGARKVVAVEPGPKLATGLRRRFGDDPRVVVRQQGLSDRPGLLRDVKFHNAWTLAQVGEFDRTNPLNAVSPGAEVFEGPEPFDVELTTLDQLVDELELEDLAFVKVDVDGYEPHVLRGAERTLRRLRPVLMIELSYLPRLLGESLDDFVGHIFELGYVVATFCGEVATKAQTIELYPYDTSGDVMMIPVELATGLPGIEEPC